jgi:non-ribosomal peptide synthetase component F
VTHANVTAFVDHILENWDFEPDDRFSQTFEFTFDLSVFDMFVCWGAGATLVCPTAKTLLNPVRWIRDAGLTVWFSVPSMVTFMSRLGGLTESRFPTLRRSLFCGEALPIAAAEAWAAAAPSSTIDNLYGPTELTIACAAHRWQRGDPSTASGTVPIGKPFPSMNALVVDSALMETDGIGELIMSGPQLTPGYLDDPDRTAAAFVVPAGQADTYYRTGDRVQVLGDGVMEYVGRVDHQIKVNGYRVELAEVEAAARAVLGGVGVVAVGHPPTPSGYGGIALAVEDNAVDVEALRSGLQTMLPAYTVPRLITSWVPLPLNSNGKVDRSAIQQELEGGR